MSLKKGDKILIDTLLGIKGEIISYDEKDSPIVKVKFEGINEPIDVPIDLIGFTDEVNSYKIEDKKLSSKIQELIDRQMQLINFTYKDNK